MLVDFSFLVDYQTHKNEKNIVITIIQKDVDDRENIFLRKMNDIFAHSFNYRVFFVDIV